MLLFKRVSDLQKYLSSLKIKDLQIGFAPTMGALHRGHISLVDRARNECQISIVSIFVNPTQFNNADDLTKYPRTPEKDIEMLAESGCDILFMPDATEIYPNGTAPSVKFNFGKLDRVLEGVFRPGHFEGMAQVVNRLLEIVNPDRLYMGQKDFQQAAIVGKMLELTKSKTELVSCAIQREEDGLAMSSRNVRLSPEDRSVATLIHKVLMETMDMVGEYNPSEIQKMALTKLKTEPRFKVEYFEIIDGRTLLPIQLFEDTDYAVAVAAVWVGDVRLIDNMILKQAIVENDIDTEGSKHVGSLR
jgi:pantoate--beta-alanine ligase